MQWLEAGGYEHYEISNFAKPGWRSRHNSSYWQGKFYYGFGPSAHSFNGQCRWWNISNNQAYIQSINQEVIPFEKETLTGIQQLNEYIMLSLRTNEGLDLEKLATIDQRFKDHLAEQILTKSKNYANRRLVTINNNRIQLTREGKLLADGIAADFFIDQW
jgi:oxygen-independent coproporphyrinogen-3 oxidase